jgi:hypothetical protein
MNAEIEKVRRKFEALKHALGERGRRLWAGTEAIALGRGGLKWVATATGMAISTVMKGRDEVLRGQPSVVVNERRPGGGRRRLESKDPGLSSALDRLVNPTTRGDPESTLLWTLKSLRVLARQLTAMKHPVSAKKVGQLLKANGYSLQAAAKTKEGVDHPHRDAQFRYINDRATDFIARGKPVISVDAKKKEFVGDYADRAREWQPKGEPVEVRSHDLFDDGSPRATPYGVYDVEKNVGFVNVGTSNNTPEFAVRSIEKWWDQLGAKLYPNAKELLITADGGGSNSPKSKVWKTGLQKFADRTGINVHVSHFPPGTSKWNKIEHRLFSFITINCRGRVLANYETVVALIGATKNAKGLKVTAELDRAEYRLGVGLSIGREDLKKLSLELASFHGDWNYVLRPRTEAQLLAAQSPPTPKHHKVGRAARKEEWLGLLFEQKESGLSARAFCKARGINRSNFQGAYERYVRKIQRTRKSDH